MNRLSVILGTHSHLPLGQPEAATETVYQKALRPFLSTLYAFPEVPVALHYSGLLLEWLEERHPELVMLIAEMVGRRQVEIVGGGYYDPILPMIPANDRLGQLEKMTTHLRVRFGTRPRGCWLAEQVWDPSLASTLRTGGMEYTFLDETQFCLAGADGQGLLRACVAEDQGKHVAVIPVQTRLLARAAAMRPPELVAELAAIAAACGPATVVALLGDGSRTGTPFASNGWLEELLGLFQQNADWLEPVTPSTHLRDSPPSSRLYFPNCASEAVTEWSLDPDRRRAWREARDAAAGAALPLPPGGYFRQFLVRYPESGLMYAKMMHTHVLVNQLRGDRYRKRAAQNELWKGQSHHAYWFGGSGGLHANRQRKAVYRSLIEAEKIIRATEIFAPSIIGVDFDADNGTEYLYQGSELNAYLHARGGALFELDFLPAAWNYLDTLVSREHDRRDAELLPRHAFIDHFLDEVTGLAEFAAGAGGSAVFGRTVWQTVELNRALPEVLLRVAGPVRAGGREVQVGIEKRFVFRPRSIDVYYRVTAGDAGLRTRLGVEINVSLASRSPGDGRLFLIGEDSSTEIGTDAREIDRATGLLVRDVPNGVSITLSSAAPFRCWSSPVEIAPSAQAVGEPEYQCHCLVPLWDLELGPKGAWENHLSIGFEKAVDIQARDGQGRP
jgi:4-alpha-glucanotransferase